ATVPGAGSPNPWTPRSDPASPRIARSSGRRPLPTPRPRYVPSRGIRPPASRPAAGRGSDRTTGSCPQPPFTGGRKRQAGTYVLRGQLGKVGQHLFRSHASRKVFQHVLHSDPHATDARLTAPLAWLDRNQVRVVHSASVLRPRSIVNDHHRPHRP